MPPDLSLAQSQQAFATALWAKAPPAGLSAPDAELRFQVYRNNVQHSLSRALAARFPVIERLVGAEFFAAMARVFIADAPPASPVLLDWGGRFPDFLDHFPPVAHLPYLADVARLECARGRAYHAADAAPLAPTALAVADPAALRFVLHPSVTLFASPLPAVQIWQSQQSGATAQPLRAGPDHALIARAPDFAIIVDPLDPATFAILSDLARGVPLGAAAHEADPTHALTVLLRHGLIVAVERDEEKWTPVFLKNHATTQNLDRDDVSIKHHPDQKTGELHDTDC